MSYTDREPRRSVELDVHMKDFSFIKTADESSVNLSQGGAFIKMEDPYPSGTLVKFKIRTPDDTVIDGVGKVAWLRTKENGDTEPSGVGIKFIKISDEGRSQLEKILETAEIIASDPPADVNEKSTSKAPKARSSAPPAATKTSKPPLSTKTSTAPSAAKASVAPGAKTSTAPSPTKSSVAPGAKSSTAPSATKSSVPPTGAKSSAPPKKADTDPARPSRPSAPAQAYNAKKTVTISFPPKAEIPAKNERPSKSPSENAPPVELTNSMKRDPAEEAAAPSEAVTGATSSTESTAPKPASPVPMMAGIAVVAILAAAAYFFMGTEDAPTVPKTNPEPAKVNPTPKPESPPPQEAAAAQPPQEEAQAVATPEEEAAPANDTAAPNAPVPADETAPAAAAAAAQEGEAAPAASEAAPLAGDRQSVELTTLPPGAAITVNGTAQEGVTPLTVSLEKGKESVITARIAGYLTQTANFTPSDETPNLELNMAPARIKFQMTSNPPGARILIDGKFNGTTPFTFLRKKYKPDYHYKIEKKGFQSVEGTVSEDQWVEDGRYYIFTLDAELTPE